MMMIDDDVDDDDDDKINNHSLTHRFIEHDVSMLALTVTKTHSHVWMFGSQGYVSRKIPRQ